MQNSRLAQRKLRLEKHPVKKKKQPVKRFVLLILGIILILGFIIWHFGIFRSWNGKNKISIASQNKGNVSILILDPSSQAVTSIDIPGNTEVEAAHQLGTWKLGSIGKLGEDEKLGGEFLKDTVINSFKFPVSAWIKDRESNLSLLDRLQIWLFTLSVGNSGKTNISLADTSYLTKGKLIDGTLGYEINENMPLDTKVFFTQASLAKANLNVVIENAGGGKANANIVGKTLEALGLNITSIKDIDVSDTDCIVKGENSLALDEISKIFTCQKSQTKAADNFDIEVTIGKKFKDRF